jgi:hypothetical protein
MKMSVICAHFWLLRLYGYVMRTYMFVVFLLDTAAVAAVAPVAAVAVQSAVTAVAAIEAVALIVVHPVQLLVEYWYTPVQSVR